MSQKTFPAREDIDVKKNELWNDFSETPESLCEFYDKWAESYEEDLLKIAYTHPKLMAKKVHEIIEQDKNLDQTARILDVCGGSGFFSEEIAKFGISNIDGLDASENMLKQAKAKNRYLNYFQEFVTENSLKTVAKEAYDIAATSGSFVPGHLNSKALTPLLEVLKKNGYLFIGMRASYLEDPYLSDLEDVMKSLCDKNVMKMLTKDVLENYFGDHKGVLFIFQKI